MSPVLTDMRSTSEPSIFTANVRSSGSRWPAPSTRTGRYHTQSVAFLVNIISANLRDGAVLTPLWLARCAEVKYLPLAFCIDGPKEHSARKLPETNLRRCAGV